MKQEIELKQFLRYVYAIFIVLSLFYLIGGVYLFILGYHNADLGWNFRVISERYLLTVKDKALDGNLYSPEELITIGNNQSLNGFVMVIVGALIFGVNLRGIIT